jgi:hypothetical protein
MGSTENFFSLTQYQEKAGEYIVKEKEDIVCGEKESSCLSQFFGMRQKERKIEGKNKKTLKNF